MDRLNPATSLVIADAQKKLIDPQYMKKERESQLLPRNMESCFGDFGTSPRSQRSDENRTVSLTPVAKTVRRISPTNNIRSITTFSIMLIFDIREISNSGVSISPRSKPVDFIPTSNPFEKKKITPSQFRKYYDSGKLPVSIDHGKLRNQVEWKLDLDTADYNFLLPVFFDGLREKEDPYRFLSVQGTHDLLDRGGGKAFEALPQLILPIKTALETKHPEIITTVLRVLQKLVQCDTRIGPALVGYYRQILSIFNLFKDKNFNSGDGIEYSQQKKQNLGDLIEETLEIFERTGGENAYHNIKYMIPTYESHCRIR